jgi:hypothetical protein
MKVVMLWAAIGRLMQELAYEEAHDGGFSENPLVVGLFNRSRRMAAVPALPPAPAPEVTGPKWWRWAGEEGGELRITLFGDADSPATPWAMDAAGAETPEEVGYARYQRVNFCFNFSQFRAYEEVVQAFQHVCLLLGALGWRRIVEGGMGLCSMGPLSSSDSPECWSIPGAELWSWPQYAPSGYNAASGFVVAVEKPLRPGMMQEEVDFLLQISQGLAREALGDQAVMADV